MANTVVLNVFPHIIPEYILMPEEGVERSVMGSVHFRPGTVTLTRDEFKFIVQSPAHQHLKGKYTVVSGWDEKDAEAVQAPQEANAGQFTSNLTGDAVDQPVDLATGVDIMAPKKSKFRI